MHESEESYKDINIYPRNYTLLDPILFLICAHVYTNMCMCMYTFPSIKIKYEKEKIELNAFSKFFFFFSIWPFNPVYISHILICFTFFVYFHCISLSLIYSSFNPPLISVFVSRIYFCLSFFVFASQSKPIPFSKIHYLF